MIFLLVSVLHAAIILDCLMIFCSLLFAHEVKEKRAMIRDVDEENSTQE